MPKKIIVLLLISFQMQAQNIFERGDQLLDYTLGLSSLNVYGSLKEDISLSNSMHYMSMKYKRYRANQWGYSIGISYTEMEDDHGGLSFGRSMWYIDSPEKLYTGNAFVNVISSKSLRVPINIFRDFHLSQRSFITWQMGLYLGFNLRRHSIMYTSRAVSFDYFERSREPLDIRYKPSFDVGTNLSLEYNRKISERIYLGLSGTMELSFLMSKKNALAPKGANAVSKLYQYNPFMAIDYENYYPTGYFTDILSLGITAKYKL